MYLTIGAEGLLRLTDSILTRASYFAAITTLFCMVNAGEKTARTSKD